MSKKLTLTQLKSELKKYDEKIKVTLDGDYHLHIFPQFSPDKIRELIKEMLTDQGNAEKHGITFSFNIIEWGLFNIIKFFSDLGIPSEIGKKVQAYTLLKNSDYFEKILAAFPQESLDKVALALQKTSSNLDKIMAMDIEDRNKFLQALNTNQEILQ